MRFLDCHTLIRKPLSCGTGVAIRKFHHWEHARVLREALKALGERWAT